MKTTRWDCSGDTGSRVPGGGGQPSEMVSMLFPIVSHRGRVEGNRPAWPGRRESAACQQRRIPPFRPQDVDQVVPEGEVA